MAQTQLQRHPVRAAIWGLVLGLGVGVYLTFVWPVIGLDDVETVALKWAVVVGAVMVLSIFWGLFGPAKKPRGMAPAYADVAPPALIEETPPPAPEEAPPPPAEG